MANVYTKVITQQGDRNLTLKLTGVLDTSNEAYNIKLALADSTDITATGFRLNRILFSVSDPLEIQLYWDAPTKQIILPIAGRGTMNFKDFGGLNNSGVANATGAVGLLTSGWTAGTATYLVIMEFIK